MVGVILIFFVLEDVESQGLILNDAIPTYSFLLIELLNDLVLSLDLHLRLFKQRHQLLHSILPIYLRRVLDGLCTLSESKSSYCFSLVVGRGRHIHDEAG